MGSASNDPKKVLMQAKEIGTVLVIFTRKPASTL